jgi:hypothetical protein
MVEMWSECDAKEVLDKLELAFLETPHRFFTEHDLHSHLYHLVETRLANRGELFYSTADGEKVSLVHHEYPTPFRCDMSKHGFRIAGEGERTPKGGLFRRGHYDLVVLNPDFVVENDLVTVSGIIYEQFKSVKSKIKATPLSWACEILFGAHVNVPALPRNWIELVKQDANKIIATCKCKVGAGVTFLTSGDIVVFQGIKPNAKTKKLEKEIREFEIQSHSKIRFVTIQ